MQAHVCRHRHRHRHRQTETETETETETKTDTDTHLHVEGLFHFGERTEIQVSECCRMPPQKNSKFPFPTTKEAKKTLVQKAPRKKKKKKEKPTANIK
jgi:hypothetical protein